MEFQVSRKSAKVPLILLAGIPLFFFLGVQNSIVFYLNLPKDVPSAGFLVFYQPTCPHCISEIPVLKELVKKGYRVSAVNVFERRDLAAEFNVTGTPTIVVFPGRIVLEGEQSLDTLVSALEGGQFSLIEGGTCNTEGKTC